MPLINGSINSLALSYLNVAEMTKFKQAEDTIKQGGNYFLSLLPAIGQIGLFISDLNSTIPHFTSHTTLAFAATRISSLMLTVLTVTAYVAKAKFIGEDKDSILKHKWVASVIDFTAKRATDIVQVALVVVNIAKFSIRMQGEATLSLLALTVGYADRTGYLPKRVSLFYNKQFTVITSTILFLIGSPLQKFVAFCDLFFKIAPVVLTKAFYELDGVCQKFWTSYGLHYPKLKVVENLSNEEPKQRKCSFEQLEKTQVPTEDFVIDPSHAKWTPALQINQSNLTDNTHMDLWETLDFTDVATYRILETKLMADERFQNDIIPTIVDADIKTIAETLSKQRKTLFGVVSHEQAATEEANSKMEQEQKACRNELEANPEKLARWKKYVIAITKEQYVIFFKNINGEKKAVGNTYEGFEEAQKKSKQILAIVAKMDSQIKAGTCKGDIEEARSLIRTILLNFAIDGGDYCVQGIKRVNQENMELILASSASIEAPVMEQLSLKLKNERINIFRTAVSQLLSFQVQTSVNNSDQAQHVTFDDMAEVFETRAGVTLPNFIKGKDSYGRRALSSAGNIFIRFCEKMTKMSQEAGRDTHSMNEFILSYGQGLGLPVDEARQDSTLNVGAFTEFMLPVLAPAGRAIVWHNAYPFEEAEESSGVLSTIGSIGSRVSNMIPTAVVNGASSLKDKIADAMPEKVTKVVDYVKDVKKRILEDEIPQIVGKVKAVAECSNLLSVDSYVDSLVELVRVNELNMQVVEWWTGYIDSNPDFDDTQKGKLKELIEDYNGDGLFVYDAASGRTALNRSWAVKMLQINGYLRTRNRKGS